MGFEILAFNFCMEEKGSCRLLFIWMQRHHDGKWKNWSIPAEYCALLVNLFVRLWQSNSLVQEKMVNDWSEICKPLPRDRKNFLLCTVTI